MTKEYAFLTLTDCDDRKDDAKLAARVAEGWQVAHVIPPANAAFSPVYGVPQLAVDFARLLLERDI